MKSFMLALIALFCSSTAFSKGKVEFDPARTILLNGVISGEIYEPMVNTMKALAKDGDTINIVISSPGGEVVAGSLLIDRMEQMKLAGIKFRCAVRDVAASMAFQILLHCNERYATPHSFLLWHPVRIFTRGVMTADMAYTLASQLAEADEVALHDLKAYLVMPEAELLWHFRNETLHQAINLMLLSPSFFKKVTNDISGLYAAEVALDTSSLSSGFGINQVIYIHERFLSPKKNK